MTLEPRLLRGKVAGYRIRVTDNGLEVYSTKPISKAAQARGDKTKIGVRFVYGGNSTSRTIHECDLPDGLDEVFAVRRLAQFLMGPWVEVALLGKEGDDEDLH